MKEKEKGEKAEAEKGEWEGGGEKGQKSKSGLELGAGVPHADSGGLGSRNPTGQGGDVHTAACKPSFSELARRVSRIQGSRLLGDSGSARSSPARWS